MATTTQGYQPVLVVPTTVPVRRSSVDWRRKGVQVGGLALGLPCVICLAAFGCIFLLSGISSLAIDSSFDDSIFEDNEFFDDDHANPMKVMGIVMLIVGVLLIAAAIAVCYAGHRAYNKFTAGSSGRVINSNPNAPAAGAYPVGASPSGYVVGQVGGQIGSYPAPGQLVMYPAAAPPPGNYPVPYQEQPGLYPPPASGYAGPTQPQLAAGVYAPPTEGPHGASPLTYMAPMVGQPGSSSNEQYPDMAPQAPGLPQKAGLPGEVAPTAPQEPCEKPPPYSP